MSHAPDPAASTAGEQESVAHATKALAKADLLQEMTKVVGTTQFASSGALLTMPSPDLMIRGVGILGLPLCEVQATQIVSKARQDQIAKGGQNTGSIAERRAWAISHQDLSFKKPSKLWNGFITRLEERVATELRVKTPIKATLRKLLIYEAGEAPRSLDEFDKPGGTFGIMIVTLPSFHRGGQIIFKHREFSKTYEPSNPRQSFACWYHDIEHVAEPIHSGYQLVLQYGLATREVGIVPKVSNYDEKNIQIALRSLRRHLLEGTTSPKAVIYLTSEKYSQEGVNQSNQEEFARGREELIRRLGEAEGLEVVLGRLERVRIGYCLATDADFDDDLGETTDPSMMHQMIRTTDDFSMLTRLEMQQGCAMPIGLLVGRDEYVQPQRMGLPLHSPPDAEDLTNEYDFEALYPNFAGIRAAHYYRSNVIVLVPQETYFKFLWGRVQDPFERGEVRDFVDGDYFEIRQDILSQIRRSFKPGQPSWLIESFKSLCDELLKSGVESHDDEMDSYIEGMLEIAIAADNPDLAMYVVSYDLLEPHLDVGFWMGISGHNQMVWDDSPENFCSWQAALEMLLSVTEPFSDKMEALEYIKAPSSNTAEGLVNELSADDLVSNQSQTETNISPVFFHKRTIEKALSEALDRGEPFDSEDGFALATAVGQYYGAQFTGTSLENALFRLQGEFEFMIGYLGRLRGQVGDQYGASSSHQANLQQHWRTMATAVLQDFNISEAAFGDSMTLGSFSNLLQFSLQDARCHWSAEVQASGKTDLDMLLRGLIKQIWNIGKPRIITCEGILRAIASIVPRTSQNLSLPPDDVVLRDILSRFLLTLRWRVIGFKPKEKTPECVPALSCNCLPCNKINMWLLDPEKLTIEVEVSAFKAGYIHMCLWSYYEKGTLSRSTSRKPNLPRTIKKKIFLTKDPAQRAYKSLVPDAVDLIKSHNDMIRDVLGQHFYSIIIDREFSTCSLEETSESRNSYHLVGEERLEMLREELGMPPTEDVLAHSSDSLRSYLFSWYETSAPLVKDNRRNTKRAGSGSFEMPPDKK